MQQRLRAKSDGTWLLIDGEEVVGWAPDKAHALRVAAQRLDGYGTVIELDADTGLPGSEHHVEPIANEPLRSEPSPIKPDTEAKVDWLIAGLGCSPEWREPLVRAASNPDPDRRADALFETLGHTAKETLEVVHRAHPVIEWRRTPSGQQFVAAIRAFFYL